VPSRNSASWFLVFAHPYGMRTKRAFYCLNTINWDRLTMEERARPPATRSSSSGALCGESLGDVDFLCMGLSCSCRCAFEPASLFFLGLHQIFLHHECITLLVTGTPWLL
jgi:hypothetical protein